MIRRGIILAEYAAQTERLRQVRRLDVRPGDWIIVKTHHSVYTIRMLGNNDCLVSGGWFDRKGLSPFRTRIAGCTWGSSVLNKSVVAACGLCLEFGNRVLTSPIRSTVTMPYWYAN